LAVLVVGYRVEALVDRPGWVVVVLREAGRAGVLTYSAVASPVAWLSRKVMSWMSLRLLVWWPRGSSQTRAPGVEAMARPMMRLAPSCRATHIHLHGVMASIGEKTSCLLTVHKLDER
jgi:hypothetical protein